MQREDGLVENPFRITPEDNPEVYFGREKFVKKILEHLLDQIYANMPIRAVFSGSLRVGKTQLARHIKHQLIEILNGEIIIKYMKCSALHKRSTFSAFLESMLPSIGKELILEGLRLISKSNFSLNTYEKNKNHFKTNLTEEDIQNLRNGFPGNEQTLWRWLCGNILSKPEMDKLEVINKQIPSAKAILFISEAIEIQNKKLLLLIDEAEFLSIPVGNARLGFIEGLRELTDPNCSIGSIFFGTIRAEEEEGHLLFKDPIRGRIGTFNYIRLPPFKKKEIYEVVKELVKKFRRKDFKTEKGINKFKNKTKESVKKTTYPLTEEAISKLWEKSEEMEEEGNIEVVSPDIILKVLRVASGRTRRIYELNKRLPLITSKIIGNVMEKPAIFQD